jgi:Mrp family chromosome partitioning ATPase
VQIIALAAAKGGVGKTTLAAALAVAAARSGACRGRSGRSRGSAGCTIGQEAGEDGEDAPVERLPTLTVPRPPRSWSPPPPPSGAAPRAG